MQGYWPCACLSPIHCSDHLLALSLVTGMVKPFLRDTHVVFWWPLGITTEVLMCFGIPCGRRTFLPVDVTEWLLPISLVSQLDCMDAAPFSLFPPLHTQRSKGCPTLCNGRLRTCLWVQGQELCCSPDNCTSPDSCTIASSVCTTAANSELLRQKGMPRAHSLF